MNWSAPPAGTTRGLDPLGGLAHLCVRRRIACRITGHGDPSGSGDRSGLT
jgi:hypothetical protein